MTPVDLDILPACLRSLCLNSSRVSTGRLVTTASVHTVSPLKGSFHRVSV